MRQMKTTRSAGGAGGQGRPAAAAPASRKMEMALAAVGVAVLLAGIGWLYAPALRLFVESDHLAYLIDTFRWHGVWDTLANTYSHNRTRVVAPGDGGAFRPLLFALLALEKGVFGARMTGWYGLGLLLHAVITLQLFEGCVACARLARRRAAAAGSGTPAERGLELAVAGAFAGFFAWNVKAVCMVTWPHIHGYLVFIILTLLGFRLLAAFLTGQDAGRAVPRALLPAAWGALLLAAFAHELGQFVAVLAAGVLVLAAWRRGPWRPALLRGLAFLAVAVIYQLANVLDAALHRGSYQADVGYGTLLASLFSAATPGNLLRFVNFTEVQPFFPAALQTGYHGRICVGGLAGGPAWDSGWTWLGGLALLLVITACGLAWWRARQAAAPGWRWLLLAAGVTVLLYDGINVVVRVNAQPDYQVLVYNAYYGYLPLALSAFFAGTLAVFLVRHPAPAVRWGLAVLAVALCLLAGRSAVATRRATEAAAQATAPARQLLDDVQAFADGHADEPGFSMAFDHRRLGDPCFFGVPLLITLFTPQLDAVHPRYVLTRGEAGLVWVDGDRFLNSPGARDASLAELAAVGTDYVVFRHARRYEAIIYSPRVPVTASVAWSTSCAGAEQVARDLLRNTSGEVLLKQAVRKSAPRPGPAAR